MNDEDLFADVLKCSGVPTMCSGMDALKELFPEDFDPEFAAKYHEVGIIKEGDRITGAIIKTGSAFDDTKWLYVSYDEFISLVKEKEIKYLQWNTDRNRIALRKAEANSYIENINSIDSYFKHDVIFNCKPDSSTIPCAILQFCNLTG